MSRALASGGPARPGRAGLAGALVALLGLLAGACSGLEAGTEVKPRGAAAQSPDARVSLRGPELPLHEVRRVRFVHEVGAEGNLTAVTSTPVTVPVSSQRAYTIAWVAPDASPVAQGDVIVRFDRSELEQQLENGRAELSAVTNKIRKADAEVRAQLENLGRDVEVAELSVAAARDFQPMDEVIFSRHEIVEGEIDTKLAAARSAHAAGSRARRASEAASEAELLAIEKRMAETNIERAEQGLAAIEVLAPHDGILLLERNWRGEVVRAGTSVWQGQPLARIPELATMEAEVHVLEADAGGLAPGLPATVVVEAHPELAFPARVKRVDDLAKPRVRGVPVQYFGVTLELEETDPAMMKPGQRVFARLRLSERDDVVVIPRQAVFEREGERVAYVRQGEGYLEVVLKLGPGTPGRIVVEQGLEGGERIALSDPLARLVTGGQALASALSSLTSHGLRSALTMLGMVFGVGAVIAMLAIGAGAEQEALAGIERLGLRNLIVRSKTFKEAELREIRTKSLGVSPRDVEAIEEALPGVERAVGRVSIEPWIVLADGAKAKAQVHGVSAAHAALFHLELDEGRFLDARDQAEHAQVCVIGPGVRRELFGYGAALGRELKVNDVWLTVVGILRGTGGAASSFEGVSFGSTENEIYLPLTTAIRKFDRDPLESPLAEIVVRLAPGTPPGETATVLRPLLERLHGGQDDFDLVVPAALLAQAQRTQRLFNIVMGCIAGISLLVGGIGIMNIMLATVLERTREIGIRRAVGARQVDIRRQFLFEAFSISALGGLAGVALGIAIAELVARSAGWPTVVTAWSVLLSTGVSVGVGLVSGLYPAMRAAKLDPIEALRSD